MAIVFSKLFDEELLVESSYEKLSVLDSCYVALDEGVFDTRVIDTATTYTYSLVMDILESVKEKLLELCSFLLSMLNNFILNNVKLIDRYREVLKDKLSKMNRPFIYEYYEYPERKNYPTVLKSASAVEDDVKKLQKIILEEGWVGPEVSNAVDDMLEEFSKKTVGGSVDASNLRQSVEGIVREHVVGNKVTKKLTAGDLDKFIDDIKGYKSRSDEIKRLRKSIVADYNILKKTYEKAVKPGPDISGATKLELVFDRDRASFVANEKERFADIQVQMSRLFNGFITIYDVAFGTSLAILQEKVEMDKAIIQELVKQTQLTALLNTKDVNSERNPFKYEPGIRT